MDFFGISGLESEITYSGLKLNERLATAGTGPRYKVFEIGGLDDADVRDAREVNPARDGELALPAYYGGRTISITGRIMAGNVAELRIMQQNLRTAFGDLSEKQLVFDNGFGTNVYINARKAAPIQIREAQANAQPTRDFMVALRASDPRFYSAATQTAGVSGVTSSITFNAINGGNANVDPVIRLNGPFAPLLPSQTEFSIRNTTSGDDLYLSVSSGTLAATSFHADINSKTRSISGDYNYTQFLSGSLFPRLRPGTNTFAVVGLTGTGSVTLYYQSAWM